MIMPWDAKRDALREDEMMIDQLEENLTLENYAEHMGEINRLARSRDASCRIRLADLLCGFPNPHAKDTLLALTEDASYLVQTNAINSLSAFPGDDTLAAAMRHPLVRGYAYICAGMAGRSLGDEERAGLRNRLSAIRETDTLLPDYYDSDIEERFLAMSKTKTVHGECFLTAMIEYEEYTEDELRPYFDKEFEERILPPVYQGKKYILDHLGNLYSLTLRKEEVMRKLKS